VGAREVNVMRWMMKNHPDLFKGCRDIWERVPVKEPMNGVQTEFELVPYPQRCAQWYPLTSEVDRDKGEITKKGVNFLKFWFMPQEAHNGEVYILPIRDHHEMYHKLFFSVTQYVRPAQVLVKLRAYAYYTWLWDSYEKFKRIHDEIMTKHYGSVKEISEDDFLKTEIPRKLGISLEEVRAGFPTREQVLAFYQPHKRLEYDGITDIRRKIYASRYRSVPFVVWDLIRQQNYIKDIPGKYARSFYTDFYIRQAERRKKAGLAPHDPLARGRCPPRELGPRRQVH